MQRLALSADAPVTETVMRICVLGAETCPLTSKVMTVGTIGEAAKLSDSRAGLRVLMFSVPAVRVQPEAQSALAAVMLTLTLRFNASLRASNKSLVMSYDKDLTFWLAANERNPGTALAATTPSTARTVINSTSVKPLAAKDRRVHEAVNTR